MTLRKIGLLAAAAPVFAAMMFAAPAPAHADRWHRGGGGNAGAVIAGGLIGLGVGAVVAGALQPVVPVPERPVYYAPPPPPPVYYAPAPAYYAPPPAYYVAPGYYAPPPPPPGYYRPYRGW